VLVLTSDHGESWGDHGLPSHGFGLYQSQIHIPLIFWKSGDGALGSAKVTTPVSLSDLAPSLLEGFGLPPLEESDGVSLVPGLAGGELARGPVLSALLRFVWAPDAPRQYAVTTPEQRVSIRPEGGRERSYDLVVDPRELRPLARPDPAAARALDGMLARQAQRAAAFDARHGPVVPGPVTAEDSARLRALGYLGDPGPAERTPEGAGPEGSGEGDRAGSAARASDPAPSSARPPGP
jgi:arylsulfatase A-like enzyme